MTPRIEEVKARELLDSRGRPTVEVEISLEGGCKGRAIVPSGASTGRHEALELRDREAARHGGLGVLKAVKNVREVIAPELIGKSVFNQEGIDSLLLSLDGTKNKSKLGANAMLAVSMAAARSAAAALEMPLWRYLGGEEARVLPLPMINLLSGGRHAEGRLEFQDFLIVAVGAKTFAHAMEMSSAVFLAMRTLLAERGFSVLRADEGGFGPSFSHHREALDLLLEAVEQAGFIPGGEIAFAIDAAASQFYDREKETYSLSSEGRVFDTGEMVGLFEEWVRSYPIVSLEDGLAEDDWEGWKLLTRKLGGRIQLLGDDLFVTHLERLNRGIGEGIANAILVKMNQIGTLSETLAVVRRAREAGFNPVISARSGETEDPFIADLAVAVNAGQIKIGSLTGSERLAKYNQLLRIEESLGERGVFRGGGIFAREGKR